MANPFLVRFAAALALAIFGSGHIQAFGSDKTKARPAQSQGGEAKTAQLVYKAQPRRTLTVYYPDDWKASDKRAALVIFRCRIPAQREHFRKRGMVIIKPQLAGVNSGRLPGLTLEEIARQPRPRNQVEDAKSAIRFLRANAASLGVDAERIVATGTSGGGDLALQTWLNRTFDDPQDDRSVSPRPNALVLYCPAFDGIDIWYVKTADLVGATREKAPAFLPHLAKFVKDTKALYATPLNHRADLIRLAATLGKAQGISAAEIENFQQVLLQFNQRDWQLLNPVEDALALSASRNLPKDPLPPTLIMFGARDHLYAHQKAFVEKAKSLGKEFALKIYPAPGTVSCCSLHS